jgi:hypothetical protein
MPAKTNSLAFGELSCRMARKSKRWTPERRNQSLCLSPSGHHHKVTAMPLLLWLLGVPLSLIVVLWLVHVI